MMGNQGEDVDGGKQGFGKSAASVVFRKNSPAQKASAFLPLNLVKSVLSGRNTPRTDSESPRSPSGPSRRRLSIPQEKGQGSADTPGDTASPKLAEKNFLRAPPESGHGTPLSGRARLGTAVGQGTESFHLLGVLTQSLRASILDQAAPELRTPSKLTMEDFEARRKLSVDIEGVGYLCKTFAPEVFRQLRGLYNITDDAFLASLCPPEGTSAQSYSQMSTVDTGSKSGQTFYISRDGRYFIKTVPAVEAKRLQTNLPKYFVHMKLNPNSLLCRFLGLLKLKGPNDMYLLIMGNVLDTDRDIHERYDIKGSAVGRAATSEQKAKPICVLKDFDFLARARKLEIGAKRKDRLMRQIGKDCDFLESIGMMDYSLVIGVHKQQSSSAHCHSSVQHTQTVPQDVQLADFHSTWGRYLHHDYVDGMSMDPDSYDLEDDDHPDPHSDAAAVQRAVSLSHSNRVPSHVAWFQQDDGGLASEHTTSSRQRRKIGKHSGPDEEIYFIGIIDCLTKYDAKKLAESTWKGGLFQGSGVSCVSPGRYSKRFQKFVGDLIE